jgi:hypothetical protein
MGKIICFQKALQPSSRSKVSKTCDSGLLFETFVGLDLDEGAIMGSASQLWEGAKSVQRQWDAE